MIKWKQNLRGYKINILRIRICSVLFFRIRRWSRWLSILWLLLLLLNITIAVIILRNSSLWCLRGLKLSRVIRNITLTLRMIVTTTVWSWSNRLNIAWMGILLWAKKNRNNKHIVFYIKNNFKAHIRFFLRRISWICIYLNLLRRQHRWWRRVYWLLKLWLLWGWYRIWHMSNLLLLFLELILLVDLSTWRWWWRRERRWI